MVASAPPSVWEQQSLGRLEGGRRPRCLEGRTKVESGDLLPLFSWDMAVTAPPCKPHPRTTTRRGAPVGRGRRDSLPPSPSFSCRLEREGTNRIETAGEKRLKDMKEGGVGIRVGFSHKHRGGPLSALPGRSTKWEDEGRELPGLCVLMPIIVGMEEVPRRRSASEASHWKPRRPSTLPQERRRLVEHARSRSFSNFELALDDGGDGGCGDGRKQPRNRREQQQQQQEQRRSRDQRRRPNHQARVVDVGCGGVGVGFRSWSSFSYYRLPEHRLRLTIVKLDSSSFDVQVMSSASVSDLKLAVEEIFTRSPKGEGEISWFHVWGHFCLCYKDQKLIDNKVSLKTFGIKDGDELHFIRYVSIINDPIRQRSRKHGGDYEQHKMEWTRSEVSQEHEIDGTDCDGIKTEDDSRNDFTEDHYEHAKYDDLIPHTQFKVSHSLRGWLSYSGLWFPGRTILGTMVRSRLC